MMSLLKGNVYELHALCRPMALMKWVHNQWWACFIVVHEFFKRDLSQCTRLQWNKMIHHLCGSHELCRHAHGNKVHKQSYIKCLLHRCSLAWSLSWALMSFQSIMRLLQRCTWSSLPCTCLCTRWVQLFKQIMSLLHQCRAHGAVQDEFQ